MRGGCLVIGRPNVGKTMFCLQFAKFLGLRKTQWFVERTDGQTEVVESDIRDAIDVLSKPTPRTTRRLQTFAVPVTKGRRRRQVRVTDSSGIDEEYLDQFDLRREIGQTLRAMQEASLILHIIDSAVLLSTEGTASEQQTLLAIDLALAKYGAKVGATYLILANKQDVPGASKAISVLKKWFPRSTILPVSAITADGFTEVKPYVWRMA